MADKLCAFHALLVQANARMNLNARKRQTPTMPSTAITWTRWRRWNWCAGRKAVWTWEAARVFRGFRFRSFCRRRALCCWRRRRGAWSFCARRFAAFASTPRRCACAPRTPPRPVARGVRLRSFAAVAPLRVLCELTLPLVRVGGQGGRLQRPQRARGGRAGRKRAGAAGRARRARVLPVDIPGRDWEHTLVVLEKTSPTPDKYPRRAGIPEKRPL